MEYAVLREDSVRAIENQMDLFSDDGWTLHTFSFIPDQEDGIYVAVMQRPLSPNEGGA